MSSRYVISDLITRLLIISKTFDVLQHNLQMSAGALSGAQLPVRHNEWNLDLYHKSPSQIDAETHYTFWFYYDLFPLKRGKES